MGGCVVMDVLSPATTLWFSCQVRLGGRSDVGFGDTWGAFHQSEAVIGDIDDGQVGDDAVDDPLPGEWQRAVLDDLVGAVPGEVFHQHDDPACPVHEVHRAAHA